MEKDVKEIYGNKVRVRACGLCWDGEKLLMVNHTGITPGDFWAPPGGGIEFSQSIEETLRREFREETGLHVTPGKFLFGCEFIQQPIHAIELFYDVKIDSGKLRTGSDPEIQIITEVRFLTPDEIHDIPKEELHGIFRFISSPVELLRLNGFFRI